MSIRSLSVTTAFCLPDLAVRHRGKAIDAFLSEQNHTAPAASISAIRAPTRDIPFAPETTAAIPSLASLNFNLDAINEHTDNAL